MLATMSAQRERAKSSYLIANDSALIRKATQHLDHLLAEDPGAATHDLKERRDILNHYSAQRVRDFLVSKSSRANRLRQSSPFFGILHSKERENVFEAMEVLR